MTETANRTLAAAGAVLIYACAIAFTDNHVRVIAADAGLWQFHATRTAMALVILGLVAVPLGLRLRPRRFGGVFARSAIHGAAMLIYFGALAFLPVAQVAAGLFTAPIFVLLISRFAFGHPIGPVRVFAVAMGFAGVLLVLGPSALGGASAAALLPPLPSRAEPRSLTSTFAPRAASCKAWLRPRPPPAPVTMATRPSKRRPSCEAEEEMVLMGGSRWGDGWKRKQGPHHHSA